ncbi:MerR family transcriptional regulator [Cryptosporangium arvum]|uniref:MerR family transcriptional regulator n=1 Tax=Cryptosporangium arvum TaxID=80871 RepID=UPI0004B1E4A9|nr:MerR family transcriptional regulator [Cryptosporangium arvum]
MALYPIGELSRRTGLTVKAIRFYADRGIVPATRRNATGHRLYDEDAAARLDLVRSLRDLGIDLPTIRRVLDREVTVADVAAAHAEALDATIRALRFRRAALAVIAERSELVHQLAGHTEAERRRLVEEFLQATFDGLDDFAGVRRSLTPSLPDDPTPEQIDAWVELVTLAQDPDFRAYLRSLAEQHAADREPGSVPRPDAVAVARSITPPDADRIATAYADVLGEPDTPELRHRLLARLELADDPRRYRYERLLAVVNGWAREESDEATIRRCIETMRG